MKKQLLNALLCCLMLVPATSAKADTVVEGQSTEGKDFWVTFPRADESGGKAAKPFLAISAKHAGDNTIHITNTKLNFDSTVVMTAADNRYKEVEIPDQYCYLTDGDDSNDNCFKSLHITATDTISLYAGNWPWKLDDGKKVCASFDVANVLPQPSLKEEYVIQAYSPSDHDGDAKSQGSHFAIIATEDNTVVDYCLTARTNEMWEAIDDAYYSVDPLTPEQEALVNYQLGDTLTTPVLQKGQIFYIWTGMGAKSEYDLTGSWLKARNNKKIAVFNGVPHTNIPYKVRNRDQLFEQAMPVQYWGTKFAVTASDGRLKDILGILALNDGTEVRINGNLVYTFDFATNPKHFWEFEYNVNGKDYTFESCFVETSCPCAVHQIMVSNAYDRDKEAPGDPSLAWLNPIEQVISDITFSTFQNYNHYVNIVTDTANVKFMRLQGLANQPDSSLANVFTQLNGNDSLAYARIKLDNSPKAYTLTGKTGFIANVYGLGNKESYSYSVGGSTKPLTQYITINGQIFTPDAENTLCGEDTIKFACHPDYEYEKIEWYFGDGESDLSNTDSVLHYYKQGGSYPAYVLIYRKSSNLCVGQNAVDSIPITVTIGRYVFAINEIEIPCPVEGQQQRKGKIFYSNEGHVNLQGDNVLIEFDEVAKADDFDDSELDLSNPDYFQITIPEKAQPEKSYGIHIKITSECGGTDTTMHFMLPFDNDVITQRYDNVLGLLASSFEGETLSDYQWYRVSGNDTTVVEGQVSANLNFYDLPYGGDLNDTYYLCFTINKGQSNEVMSCACAKAFSNNGKQHTFDENPENVNITATYEIKSDKVFVNADWKGKTDVECYAQWIGVDGRVYNNMRFDIPDGGCTIPTPNENGLFLLRVVTGRGSRSFKFIINK